MRARSALLLLGALLWPALLSLTAAQRVLHPISSVQLEGLEAVRSDPLFAVSPADDGCERSVEYHFLTNDPDSAEGTMTLIVGECDDAAAAIQLSCAVFGAIASPVCGTQLLSQLQTQVQAQLPTPFRAGLERRTAATLEAIAATEAFNAEADAPGSELHFTADHVTAHWPLAWLAAGVAHNHAHVEGTDGEALQRPVKVLEIGCFEGRSVLLWRRLFSHPASHLVCIEQFYHGVKPPPKSPEMEAQQAVEGAYINNTRPLVNSGFVKQQITGLPSRKALFMSPYLQTSGFDLIYVDGGKSAKDVLADLTMGDAQLHEGGVVVLASFEEASVQSAARAFLTVHADSYEVLHATRQLHLRHKKT